jgi:hypothetical protein
MMTISRGVNVAATLMLLGVFSCNAFAPASVSHRLRTASIDAQQQQLRAGEPSSLVGFQTQLSATNKESKGIYSRPSAAIERGSGFFIPGLEGPRVRLLFGLAVLILTAINHLAADDASFSLSEGLAIVYAVLLLMQAAIEFGKEDLGYVVSSSDSNGGALTKTVVATPTEGLVQRWASEEASAEWKERVQWSAASYISLTPATQMILIENDKVVYSLGKDAMEDNATDGCKAAIETLSQATSGRVSLPATHPAVMALAPDARCVVLQTIAENQCWMMTSNNQLLQAFTKQDLKWLGQLASYVKK